MPGPTIAGKAAEPDDRSRRIEPDPTLPELLDLESCGFEGVGDRHRPLGPDQGIVVQVAVHLDHQPEGQVDDVQSFRPLASEHLTLAGGRCLEPLGAPHGRRPERPQPNALRHGDRRPVASAAVEREPPAASSTLGLGGERGGDATPRDGATSRTGILVGSGPPRSPMGSPSWPDGDWGASFGVGPDHDAAGRWNSAASIPASSAASRLLGSPAAGSSRPTSGALARHDRAPERAWRWGTETAPC